jgi:hypothetical protein
MPIYPYSFTLPPVNKQDIPSDGVAGEFLGINSGGQLDWLPVSASGSGDMLKSENLSGLASYPTARTNLGLGTTDTPTFKNLAITTGSIATSAPVTISQTWNDAAVAFTAFKVNATTPGSTSASGSLLLDLQVDGTTKTKIDKSGIITANRLILDQSGSFIQIPANTAYNWTGTSFLRSPSVGVFSFENNTQANFFILAAEAPNTLALRNGANGQTFSVYGTYPGAAWERFTITAPTSGNVLLGTYKGTGGIARGLEFQTDGVTRLLINTSGGATFTGNFFVFGGGNVQIDSNKFFFWQGGSVLANSSNGVINLTNQAGSDFGRLQFGGTTSSFPALKRSTTYLQSRLADDSAFAPIQGKLTTDTAFTSGAITDTGYIVLYDSAGAAYKVACTPV